MSKVRNLRTGQWLAVEVQVASGFFGRLLGLIGRDGLPSGAGLFITPCSSIHSFFMRFPFDALFLDAEYRVVHIIHSMPPNHMSPWGLKARSVLELPAGIARETDTRVGDHLEPSEA